MSAPDSAPRHLVDDDLFRWNGDNFDSLEEKSQGDYQRPWDSSSGDAAICLQKRFSPLPWHPIFVEIFQSGAKSGGLTR